MNTCGNCGSTFTPETFHSCTARDDRARRFARAWKQSARDWRTVAGMHLAVGKRAEARADAAEAALREAVTLIEFLRERCNHHGGSLDCLDEDRIDAFLATHRKP